MRTIDHIIAPCLVNRGSDLFIAQPITFESMRRAKERASGKVEIGLLYTCFADEQVDMPGFRAVAPLIRNSADVYSFRRQRKLPILKDILDRLYKESSAEYVVYTNVDIALQPHFYTAVNEYIEQGFDAFVINRRTISGEYTSVTELECMYGESGVPHPGYDCFVFRRDLYPQFILGNVFLGSGHVDLPLVCSMILSAKQFGEFRDEHLTFHIGDSRSWWTWKNREYLRRNDRIAADALLLQARTRNKVRSMKPLIRILLQMALLKNPLLIKEWKRLFHVKG